MQFCKQDSVIIVFEIVDNSAHITAVQDRACYQKLFKCNTIIACYWRRRNNVFSVDDNCLLKNPKY